MQAPDQSSPSPEDREEELFEAARNITDPAERQAFLDRNCAGDKPLRETLEMLLSAEQGADTFFTQGRSVISELIPGLPQGGPASLHDDSEYIGKQIGRYRLLEKLGEGGWGVVYLAEQKEPVQRQVALKIIRLGMETKGIIARFEAERQALALMDHPNIARVFDAGETDRGFPYFVMELVRGERITEYCKRNQHNLEQRLKLFIQVCHAIQHAHQKGVIHRDIKPSNIMIAMVDGNPVPKVIDFGIAKATEARLGDQSNATAFLQLIGTPAYMSPEQAEMRWMDVDTRSDIYSLGVLLYELLTGKTPFDGKELMKSGVEGMKSILRDKEPPRPSQRLSALDTPELAGLAHERRMDPGRLVSHLRGDLDWVVMKALEKDRQRRYETANGLALDIQRHLNFEAVSARPPSVLYRLEKTVRRNLVVFAAGTAVALALIAGTGTSTWLLFKEREARHRAVAAEQEQATLRREAELRERITQVNLLVNQDRYEAADQLLGSLPLTRPTVEAAAAYRAVGEWHALNGRWGSAASCFRRLVQIDELDGWDIASLDMLRLGPVLLSAGEVDGYKRFRDEVLSAYVANPFPATDRVVKICLLTPLDEKMIQTLAPLAGDSRKQMAKAEAAGDAFQAAWLSLSMSIWDLRLSNPQGACDWAYRCMAYPEKNLPRAATAHAVLALALHQLKKPAEARIELQQATEIIDAKLRNQMERGSPSQGFWFDWIYARLLTQEADSKLSQAKP